jgi:hypothetical protein
MSPAAIPPDNKARLLATSEAGSSDESSGENANSR